jgi:O-acetyl-ADP-ribose deacetylase
MDNLVRKVGNTGLYVVRGDITSLPVDAIMTSINSEGMWFGGIDEAIQRKAGSFYHAQAASKMPLKDGQVVITKGDLQHRGAFKDVVFIVDDLKQPAENLVYNGLEVSSKEGYQSIALPAIRTGFMAGFVEKTSKEAIDRMGEGIARFMTNHSNSTRLKNITFVIYNDSSIQFLMEVGLRSYSLR